MILAFNLVLHVFPFSPQSAEEVIELAKSLSDQQQAQVGSAKPVSVTVHDFKHGQYGAVLSTMYAERVRDSHGRDSVDRVFVQTYALVDPEGGAPMVIDYNRIAEDVTARIRADLPLGTSLTIDEFAAVLDDKLQDIAGGVTLAVDHARAANLQTKD